MSFDWKSYLQLAHELIQHQNPAIPQEAYLRSAISRAYYAVFCIAKNFLIRNGVTIPRVDTHKFVRKRYMNSRDPIEQKIGKDLNYLWYRRKDADYEDLATFDVRRTTNAYQVASRILNHLASIGAI